VEEDTGYGAYVPSLPGVVSQGETQAEVLDNIAEALSAALESYLASEDKTIPWTPPDESTGNGGSFWLVVHV